MYWYVNSYEYDQSRVTFPSLPAGAESIEHNTRKEKTLKIKNDLVRKNNLQHEMCHSSIHEEILLARNFFQPRP
jgi:hypothetical protein